MKQSALCLALAGLAWGSPAVLRRADGLPSGCVYVNGVAFGALPSDGSASSPAYTMAELDNALGAQICGYGWYSQITSSSYSGQSPGGDQLTEVLNDVVSSGAVFQPAVMPEIPLSEFDSNIASQVASVLEQFTSQGVEVWLRFGHEMNYYIAVGTYSGSASDFINAWKIMYAAVESNSLIKMWWSPNVDSSSEPVAPYWPGSEYVDLVGVDCYPDSSSSLPSDQFSTCYSSFYNTYSAGYGIPFAIGETGYAGSSGNDAWLSQLMNQDMSTYPNYISVSWFEYDKGVDFCIIESSYLSETQDILLDGGTDSGGGGGSGSGYPADTCTWGCEGWDCSSSSPCQSAYTCVNGICGDCSWGCNGWDCSSSQPCNADYTCVSGYCHHSGPAT